MGGTQPLFDMSQAQPINSAAQGKPLFDMSKATPLPGSGEQLNDVGNRVIVPKEGESFSDTMQRAVASGKTVTQPQIDAEMKTGARKGCADSDGCPCNWRGGRGHTYGRRPGGRLRSGRFEKYFAQQSYDGSNCQGWKDGSRLRPHRCGRKVHLSRFLPRRIGDKNQ